MKNLINIKQLSFFFKCKKVLSHSLWFGDTKYLRLKTGLRFSDEKIRVYIKYLCNQGLIDVRERDGRTEYYFKKQRKYKVDYNKQIEPQLIMWYMSKKKKQFDYMSDLCKRVQMAGYNCSKREYRKYHSRLNRSYTGKQFNISYCSIGKELGISPAYAKVLIDRLVDDKLIDRTTQKVCIYQGLDAPFKFKHQYLKRGGYYLRGFRILRTSPCYYSIR